MKEYIFLFSLALIWTIVATIQDLKKREVANWLNFSFIAFALAYRAFFSLQTKNLQFFTLGFLGFLIFLALGNLFYYTKAFAGGDAKLLMAFGIILPYEKYSDLVYLSLIFLLTLFLIGAIYTLIYSFFLALKNKKQFKKEFSRQCKKRKTLLDISIIVLALSLFTVAITPFSLIILFLSLIPFIFVYVKALEKCMVKLYPASKLTEGDWLEQNVKISTSLTIKKTVHGLSLKDIQLIKKYNKSVLIKEGIPFVPAFFLTLIVTVFFFLILKYSLSELPFLSFLLI